MRPGTIKCLVLLCLLGSIGTLADQGDDFLNDKESAVEKIVRDAIINFGRQCETLKTCGNPTNCSYESCSMEAMASSVCLDVVNNMFCGSASSPCKQMNLDFGRSIASVAASTNLNSVDTMLAICGQKPLESLFKTLSNATALSRTYFGTTVGTYRIYPGLLKPMNACREFDPRLRPWYRTATSVVKITVVLVDLGASMGNDLPPDLGVGTILQAAKNMTKALLPTLSAQDYISIIAFDSSRVIQLSPSPILVKEHNGTELNILRTELDKLTVEGQNRPSNISAAMLAALPMFDVNSQAAKVIVLLTDTVFALGPDVTLPTAKLLNSKVKVFTYKLRQPQDNDVFLKNNSLIVQLCAVGGHFEPIVKNLENPLLAFRYYFSYLANLKRILTNGRPQYSQVYPDADATFGGNIITVSKPAFVEGVLIGVAGITIHIESLGNITDQVKQALASRISGYSLAAPELVLSAANCSLVNETLQPCGSSTAYYAQGGGLCKRDDSRRRTMEELMCCGTCKTKIGGLSSGVIAGIVVGIVVGAVLVLVSLWFLFRTGPHQVPPGPIPSYPGSPKSPEQTSGRV